MSLITPNAFPPQRCDLFLFSPPCILHHPLICLQLLPENKYSCQEMCRYFFSISKHSLSDLHHFRPTGSTERSNQNNYLSLMAFNQRLVCFHMNPTRDEAGCVSSSCHNSREAREAGLPSGLSFGSLNKRSETKTKQRRNELFI